MKNELSQYGKSIKKKLVDIDQTQNWLIQQIRDDTGLFMDSSYLYKIMTGKANTPKILASINRILGFDSSSENNDTTSQVQ